MSRMERSLPHCITDYIIFCIDIIVPLKSIRCFPNNNSWVTKDIKALLNEKKEAFRSGDREAAKEAARRLSVKLKEGRDRYRRKLELKLQNNNTKDVWRGMRTNPIFKSSCQGMEGDVRWANELNQFFNRFDNVLSSSVPLSHTNVSLPSFTSTSPGCNSPHDLSSSFTIPLTRASSAFSLDNTSDYQEPAITITEDQVSRELRRLCPTKASGPDGISPQMLKLCTTQL